MAKIGAPVAIVTGGGSGIGQAFCEALARRGWRVIVADRNEANAGRVAEGITRSGGRAAVRTVDVADERQVEELVIGTAEERGRLDMLINNAGIAIAGEITDIEVAEWRRVLDVNLWSQIVGCYHAMRVMREQGFGRIVNVSSGLGLVPTARSGAYVTSKYGSVGLSLALRPEAAAYGVKVNVICPGPVRTPILQGDTRRNEDPELRRRRMRRMERWMLTPEEAVRRYLRGLARDRAVIVGPGMTKFWWLFRLSPALVEHLVGRREMGEYFAAIGRTPRWHAKNPAEVLG